MSLVRIQNQHDVVYEAIRQRLIYSFGFTYDQADKEIDFLFATLSILFTRDYYVFTVRRHATKSLNRQQKFQIWEYVKRTIEEHNSGV